MDNSVSRILQILVVVAPSHLFKQRHWRQFVLIVTHEKRCAAGSSSLMILIDEGTGIWVVLGKHRYTDLCHV
jgi:hypothetical protein